MIAHHPPRTCISHWNQSRRYKELLTETNAVQIRYQFVLPPLESKRRSPGTWILMDESCSCACYYNSIACCDTESHSSRESWWTTIHRWVSLPRQCFYYYYTLLLYSPVTSYLLTLRPLGPAHSKHTSSSSHGFCWCYWGCSTRSSLPMLIVFVVLLSTISDTSI